MLSGLLTGFASRCLGALTYRGTNSALVVNAGENRRLLFANSFVNAARPARNTPEVGNAASGSKVANVEVFTMEPAFCSCMIGVTNRATHTTFNR